VDILPLLDELQSIARTGLNFSPSPYDRERYQRLLTLVSAYYGQVLDLPPPEVRQRFSSELGYITPKVGAEAAIFDPEGRILLVRRSDDGLWCLPCGWVEPNESPEEAAIREAGEETGLEVRPRHLVGVFTRKPNCGHGPHTAIAVVYLCDVLGERCGDRTKSWRWDTGGSKRCPGGTSCTSSTPWRLTPPGRGARKIQQANDGRHQPIQPSAPSDRVGGTASAWRGTRWDGRRTTRVGWGG
jgi:ADP-ribose pyrophosphatase YjhB (NUDIX family)